MVHPVSNIIVETMLSIDPLLCRFGNVRVAKDHEIEPFQKLLVGKGSKGGGGLRRPVLVVVPVTPFIQLLCNPPCEGRTHPAKDALCHPVLEESPESEIFPLARVRQISMSDESPFGAQGLLMPPGVNLHVHPEVRCKKRS